MGGEGSVSASTRDLLLEAAFFTPDLLSGQGPFLRPHTESSHRFERGLISSYRWRLWNARASCCCLLSAGKRVRLSRRSPGPLALAPCGDPAAERIGKMLGLELPAAEVERILGGPGSKQLPRPMADLQCAPAGASILRLRPICWKNWPGCMATTVCLPPISRPRSSCRPGPRNSWAYASCAGI